MVHGTGTASGINIMMARNGTPEGRSRRLRLATTTVDSTVHRDIVCVIVGVSQVYKCDDSISIDCTVCTIAFLQSLRHRPAFLRPLLFCRKMAYSYSPPDPSTCALDAFRTSIAERVAAALPPLTVEQAYSGVDYGKKGADFTIALPRFKLGKPEDVAAKVIAQVGLLLGYFFFV